MAANTKITFEQVEQKRRAFAQAVRTFGKQKGRYHNPAPELPAAKLDGCEVLHNREALLDKAPRGGMMGQIGAGQGNFTAEILERCRPEKLHLFDVTELTNPKVRAEMALQNSRLKTQLGENIIAMRKMPNTYFDLVYIDGVLEHEALTTLIEAVLPKMKPSGVLIFNNYTVWSANSMYHCGVARAVNELCLVHPWKFRFLALQPMMYNDVMLVRE
jgi:hypothetical protein